MVVCHSINVFYVFKILPFSRPLPTLLLSQRRSLFRSLGNTSDLFPVCTQKYFENLNRNKPRGARV